MTSWLTIAVADLEDYLLEPQMTALRTVALADGQADPFTKVMQDRCNYIRNRIAGRVQISATAYAVPPELKSQTCLLIIEAMQPRLAVLPLTEDQKTLIATAKKDLDIAGTSDLPISSPTDPTDVEAQSGSGHVSVVRKPTTVLTRDDMAGL